MPVLKQAHAPVHDDQEHDEQGESSIEKIELKEVAVKAPDQRKIKCKCGSTSCRIGPFVDAETGDAVDTTTEEAQDCGCFDD